jgi:lauroyl/myristoyl acyltransferase
MTPISKADLSRAAKLLSLTPPSWLLPVDSLLPVARKLRSLRVAATPIAGRARSLAQVLSDYVTMQQAFAIVSDLSDRLVEAQMQILALHRPARRWQPMIRWHGFDNIAAALDRGLGAILWVSDFVYGSLVTKMALHQSGIAVSHLSRPSHGFSVSPFGIRFLNPLWTRIEDQFIAERVMIIGNEASEALKILRMRLASNHVVSILVADTARRTLDTKFFRGAIRIATGPPHLSHVSGAPLLPVFTLRGDDGVYDVMIGRPLDVGCAEESNYALAVRTYAMMLESQVLAHRDQWNGWFTMNLLAETPGIGRDFVDK